MKPELIKQLRRDEGEVLTGYQDHLGFLTIGVGRLIDKRKGGGITPEESAYLLDNDIDKREADLLRRAPWMALLDPVRFGVMMNMAFQMGVDGLLGFKNTLAMVRDGDYATAAEGMLQSLWAEQTPERAKRLSDQMRSGVWQ
jgi:lysozyme